METRYLIHETSRPIAARGHMIDIIGQAHGIERPDGLYWHITINEGARGTIELPSVGPHRMTREAFQATARKRLEQMLDERQGVIQHFDRGKPPGPWTVDRKTLAIRCCDYAGQHAGILTLEAWAEALRCRHAAGIRAAPPRDLTVWQTVGEMLGWGGLPA